MNFVWFQRIKIHFIQRFSKLLVITFSLLLFIASELHAMETDQFQKRQGYKDLTSEMNQKMNEVLAQISERHLACSKTPLMSEKVQLFKILLDELGGYATSKIEKWVTESPESKAVPLSDSIYAGFVDFKFFIFTQLGRWWPTVQPCCASVIQLHKNLVSSDKMGHFIHSGYQMYYEADLRAQLFPNSSDFVTDFVDHWLDRYQLHHNGIEGVFELSDLMEQKSYGLQVTSIYSYADIVSNYEGYLFWSSLLEGDEPYFHCQKGYWQQSRNFDWSLYVNAGWDEALNCNRYTESMEKHVQHVTTLKKIKGDLTNYECPVESQRCVLLKQKYGKMASRLLHPKCLNDL